MAAGKSGKIAFITGANKGIGYEVARQLGKQSITVLLGARNPELGRKAEETLKAEGIDAHFVQLEVTDEASVKKAAETVAAEYGKVDILINNAGIFLQNDGPPSVADMAAVRKTIEVNVYGALYVTQAFVPLVKKCDAGRIVNVSSGLGSLTWNADPNWAFSGFKPVGYNGSKAMLNMITVMLAYELRDTNIKVNAANPGYTATDINGNSGTQTVEEGAAETVRLALLDEDGPTGSFSETGQIIPW
jgi:NAD(P)-dependent dehydrogenase (short-subunit alcohol dehydrogenase family)